MTWSSGWHIWEEKEAQYVESAERQVLGNSFPVRKVVVVEIIQGLAGNWKSICFNSG